MLVTASHLNRSTLGKEFDTGDGGEAGAASLCDGSLEMTNRVDAIAADPRYLALVARRSRFAWVLTLAILIVYFGFIGLVAFDKAFLAASLSGGATSLGIPVGLGIILFAIVLTGIYVRRANGEFDAATAAILAEHDA